MQDCLGIDFQFTAIRSDTRYALMHAITGIQYTNTGALIEPDMNNYLGFQQILMPDCTCAKNMEDL